MKLLHLSSERTWRGGEQQIAYLIEESIKSGIECIVGCKKGSEFENWCKEKDVKYYSLGFKNQDIDTTLKEISLLKHHGLIIYNSSALKENQTPTLNKYYINETSIQYQYKTGLKTGFISGFDVLYNPSLMQYTNKKIQCGLFIGHLLHLDQIKIGLLMGTYLYNSKDRSEMFYHKLFTEYHFTNKLSARLTLKSHWAKADYFSLGVGYKI